MDSRDTRLARSLVGLAVAVLVPLVACGGNEPGEPDRPAAAPCGITVRRTQHLTLENAAEALAEAADRPLTQRFRTDITQDGDTATLEGVGESDRERLVSVDLTTTGGEGADLHLIYVDDLFYVSGDRLTPKGKFVPVDPENPKDPVAKPLKAYLDSASVTDSLGVWEAGLVAVRYVGDETLDDGAATELYEFDVDPRVTARLAGEEVPPGLPTVVTWYVWVDRYNLVHKLQSTYAGAKTVMAFSGYCEDIDVKAPAKADLIPR